MKKVLFILTCNHIMLVPVNLYTSITECLVCHQDARVKDVHVYEWHSACLRKGCTFGKWHGVSQGNAERSALGHERRTAHEVGVEYAVNPVAGRLRTELIRNELINVLP